MSKKILVIGGGISGLTAAYTLKKRGFEVKILEAKERLGGVINTLSENGFRAESGSNTVMIQSQKTLDFVNGLGLENRLVKSSDTSKKRFFVKNGKICEVPMSPLKMLFSPLFSLMGKIRMFCELKKAPHPADSDPSIAEFTTYRLGKEALDYGMNPFMAGIYGGNPEKLSARYAFPPFWNLEQKYGSIIKGAGASRKEKQATGNFFKPMMISFQNGLCELVDSLAYELSKDAILSANIVSIDYEAGQWDVCWTSPTSDDGDTFDEMIIAIPAREIAKLPLPFPVARLLEKVQNIEYAPIVSYTMGFQRSQIKHALDGFGALIPEKESQYRILGALFVSSLFENRAPRDFATITCYIGGMRHPELFKASDEELKQIILEDLQGLIGLSGNPVFERIFRWENGIAQYNVGYGEILESMDEFEKEFPTIKLLGAYRGGVGVSSCIENALACAEKIKQ